MSALKSLCLSARSFGRLPKSTANLCAISKRSYVLDFQGKEPFYPRPGRSPLLCSKPSEAVECISDNFRVFVHGMAATPQALVQALAEHAADRNLQNIELVHLLTAGSAPQISPQFSKHFKDSSLFVSDNVRTAVNEGRAEYVPIFLSEIPLLFASGDFPLDAAMLHVSPPDRAGFCSLGVNVDVTRAAAANARILIGCINKHMPRTHGDGHVHISQFDYICERDAKLPEQPHRTLNQEELETRRKIGEIVANELIDDGSTLQLGLGEIPQEILRNLTNHRDLGIHTEMFGDQLLDLFDTGVITNAKKFEHPGKTVASFVLGSQRLYDYVDDNPRVQLFESNYVNDTANIARNPNVCAVNTAVEIDLTGQTVSDSIGANIYSGVGGQVDFIRGAAYSRGGKPIITITSTTSKGESKIVTFLKKGAGVVTTRAHIRYVVTEYGCVNLFGKNLKERAQALISIAHPKYREWLSREAHERFQGNWQYV